MRPLVQPLATCALHMALVSEAHMVCCVEHLGDGGEEGWYCFHLLPFCCCLKWEQEQQRRGLAVSSGSYLDTCFVLPL